MKLQRYLIDFGAAVFGDLEMLFYAVNLSKWASIENCSAKHKKLRRFIETITTLMKPNLSKMEHGDTTKSSASVSHDVSSTLLASLPLIQDGPTALSCSD